jgi:hypothetical protein
VGNLEPTKDEPSPRDKAMDVVADADALVHRVPA